MSLTPNIDIMCDLLSRVEMRGRLRNILIRIPTEERKAPHQIVIPMIIRILHEYDILVSDEVFIEALDEFCAKVVPGAAKIYRNSEDPEAEAMAAAVCVFIMLNMPDMLREAPEGGNMAGIVKH